MQMILFPYKPYKSLKPSPKTLFLAQIDITVVANCLIRRFTSSSETRSQIYWVETLAAANKLTEQQFTLLIAKARETKATSEAIGEFTSKLQREFELEETEVPKLCESNENVNLIL